jgi:hypothetical protein
MAGFEVSTEAARRRSSASAAPRRSPGQVIFVASDQADFMTGETVYVRAAAPAYRIAED